MAIHGRKRKPGPKKKAGLLGCGSTEAKLSMSANFGAGDSQMLGLLEESLDEGQSSRPRPPMKRLASAEGHKCGNLFS